MLVAGASASSPPARGGALTFDMNTSPSGAWWYIGSAFLLFAGACTSDNSTGGALAFLISAIPSVAWWSDGSAV